MKALAFFAMAASVLASPCTVLGEDSPATRLSLKRLPGVALRVMPLSDDAQRFGVSADRLEAVSRARLGAAKIRVLSAAEQLRTPGRPALHLHVAVLRLDSGEALYSVHLDLKQWVALLSQPGATLDTALAVPATTWAPNYRFGITPSEEVSADVMAAARQMFDEFVNAYRRANPSKPARP